MRGAVTTTQVRTMARLIVDPNRVSRSNPDLSSVGFEDADRIPDVGDQVLAVQPDEDGSAYVGRATVERIDLEHRLIFVRVDWESFADEQVYAPVSVGMQGTAISDVHWTARWRPKRSAPALLAGPFSAAANPNRRVRMAR